MSRECGSADGKLTVSAPGGLGNLNAFTYACWAYPRNNLGINTVLPRILSKASSGGVEKKRLAVTVLVSGRRISALVARATTAASAVTPFFAVNVDAWNHLAMTYSEADGIRLYQGGTETAYQVRTVGAGATDADSGGDFVMLSTVDGLNTFDGRLAEVGVWNRVLSAAELSLLAGGRAPRLIRSGLVGVWPLIGTSSPESELVAGASASVSNLSSAAHPPSIVPALPERVTRVGTSRGMMRAVM